MTKKINKLEQEFLLLKKTTLQKIKEKLKEANKALEEAEKLSEETGVPFSSGVSPIWNRYTPKSFQQKFGTLNEEFLREATDEYIDEYDQGWKYSQAGC